MTGMYVSGEMPVNNERNPYSDLLYKLTDLSEKTVNLTKKLNRIDDRLKILNERKASILSRIDTSKGTATEQQLTNNWTHVLQEIRKRQKEKIALQNEKNRMDKKKETLQTTRMLAFNQFKNKKNKMNTIENPFIIEIENDLT